MLYSASECAALIAVSITFFAIALICTILRLYVRVRLDRSLAPNDATIILATVSSYAAFNHIVFSDPPYRWHTPYVV